MKRLAGIAAVVAPTVVTLVMTATLGPQAGLLFAAGSMVSAAVGLVIWARGLG